MSAHSPAGGGPFSFSILRTVSRRRRSSLGFGADHMAGHDRGRGLAERAGFHVMGEIGDHRAIHFQVDGDGGTAQLGMGGGAGVGRGKPAQARDIARQVEDFGCCKPR